MCWEQVFCSLDGELARVVFSLQHDLGCSYCCTSGQHVLTLAGSYAFGQFERYSVECFWRRSFGAVALKIIVFIFGFDSCVSKCDWFCDSSFVS